MYVGNRWSRLHCFNWSKSTSMKLRAKKNNELLALRNCQWYQGWLCKSNGFNWHSLINLGIRRTYLRFKFVSQWIAIEFVAFINNMSLITQWEQSGLFCFSLEFPIVVVIVVGGIESWTVKRSNRDDVSWVMEWWTVDVLLKQQG